MSIQSVNPATEEIIKSFAEDSSEDVLIRLDKCYAAFLKWREEPFTERKRLMLNASKILREKKEEFGKMMTMEMGKPVKQSYAEIEKCAWVCEYYAENAETVLSKEVIQTDATESYIQFDPLGIILAIMPWNFPFWQVFRFAAPALMAGNAALLKHASNVPMCALAIEEIFKEAGFPLNLFSTLLISSSQVESVIKNPMVAAVTLTGSDPAGRKVAGFAGANLKKTVLELGGSDPFIVLKDADISAAAKTGVTSRIINNGQSCISAKRFIAVKEVAGEFQKEFVRLMNELKIGDPIEIDTDLGPLAREDLLIDLDLQVKKSVEMGAEILTGGKRLNRKGFFYSPTVLTNISRNMPVFREETFGPVAAIIVAEDEEEAIMLANETEFGLGASIWTKDIKRAKTLVRKIHSGSVFVNGMVKSDPRLPFGGIKNSGYGRELSHYGIKEFVNIKTIWIG